MQRASITEPFPHGGGTSLAFVFFKRVKHIVVPLPDNNELLGEHLSLAHIKILRCNGDTSDSAHPASRNTHR
jgi:hypothetical protein